MGKTPPNYMTTDDLQARWKCQYAYANAFMHRKGIKSIKIGKRLLVDEREVIAYEKTQLVRNDH